MERAAASSRCAGPARVSQPLSLYRVGRALSARVGINQPQADRFLAPTLGLVPTSIEVQTLAYGTGRAGARNDRKSLTGAPGAEGRVLQWSCHKWSSQGRDSAPEDGTKASERIFSGANWL